MDCSKFLIVFVLFFISSASPSVINSQLQPQQGNSIQQQSGQNNKGTGTDSQPSDLVYYYTNPGQQQQQQPDSPPNINAVYREPTPHTFSGDGSPWAALNSNMGFSLSAYFGPIILCIFAVIIVIAFIVWICQFFGAWGDFGGIVKKIKERGGVGKSLDLDNLTNMVYEALDTYGKWTEKSIQNGETHDGKQ